VKQSMEKLCQLLSADSGIQVEPFYAASPSRMAAALVDGKAHVAWMSPTLMLMSPELETAVPLLSSVRQGVAYFHSVLFCAESAPFEEVTDLVGARAAWVAPTSASGYLVPKLMLAQIGVDLRRAFVQEDFLDSHGAVVRAVMEEASADVGATYASFERGDASQPLLSAGFRDAGHEKVRILLTSGPIPADMIVANPSVTIQERVAFAGALCRLAQVADKTVKEVIGAQDFRAVSHEALAELGRLMKSAAEGDAL
jgi:phosphonate transport system substrate-binding protein